VPLALYRHISLPCCAANVHAAHIQGWRAGRRRYVRTDLWRLFLPRHIVLRGNKNGNQAYKLAAYIDVVPRNTG
jgi:hypothetical protein